jgi:NIMA (never in mitosis gene a)-related kinase
MKQIDLSFLEDSEKSEALKEARLLELLRHPNIIEFKEVFRTKTGKLCIVMEYGENGDLQKHVNYRKEILRKKNGKDPSYSEDEVLDIIAQVVRAINHIHDL